MSKKQIDLCLVSVIYFTALNRNVSKVTLICENIMDIARIRKKEKDLLMYSKITYINNKISV